MHGDLDLVSRNGDVHSAENLIPALALSEFEGLLLSFFFNALVEKL